MKLKSAQTKRERRSALEPSSKKFVSDVPYNFLRHTFAVKRSLNLLPRKIELFRATRVSWTVGKRNNTKVDGWVGEDRSAGWVSGDGWGLLDM